MKKVLLVDDVVRYHGSIALQMNRLAPNAIQVIGAFSAEQASRIFAEHPDIDLIVMDGNLGDESNTSDLVRTMRETFKGPIIANSGSPESNIKLVAAGCSHRTSDQSPDNIAGFILKILGIQ